MRIDQERLTALVLLGLKDRDTFPLIFYRENCADMAVDEARFRRGVHRVIESAADHRHALLRPSRCNRTAAARSITRARNDVRTVLDIDYRPVLWGLTGKADGETRFVASEGVTAHLQRILPLFDLVIGTEEEFRIAGGKTELDRRTRDGARRDAGHAGCQARADGLPDHRRRQYPQRSTMCRFMAASRWKY